VPAASDTPTLDTGAPLAGRSVIVTRAEDQARALADPLEALGAEVLPFPVIAIADPPDWSLADEAIARIGEYHWIVAEGLVEEFRRLQVGEGYRIMLPRALDGRDVLPDALRSWGVIVDVAPVYQTVKGEPGPGVIERLREGSVDVATFTSPSTFRNFASMLQAAGLDADKALRAMALASIGPVTSDAIRGLGHEVAIEPDRSTVTELVAAVGKYFAAHDTEVPMIDTSPSG